MQSLLPTQYSNSHIVRLKIRKPGLAGIRANRRASWSSWAGGGDLASCSRWCCLAAA